MAADSETSSKDVLTISDILSTSEKLMQNNAISSEIGVIHPPAEVKVIIEKTALFVAKNGVEFEEKIRANEQNNALFNFLNKNDPYFPYYNMKIGENIIAIKNQKLGNMVEPVRIFIPESEKNATAETNRVVMEPSKRLVQKIIEIPSYVNLHEYPHYNHLKPYEFLVTHPKILLMDLDIIKMTAQYVAKGGRNFLNNLSHRENRNVFFDFLKPQHPNYGYFISMVEQYTKLLNPVPALISEVKEGTQNRQFTIVQRIQDKAYCEKQKRDDKERETAEAEKDKLAYSQIDWHDFVIVEVITFKDDDASILPPPVTLEKLGERVIEQERLEHTEVVQDEIDEKLEKLKVTIEEEALQAETIEMPCEPEESVRKKDVVILQQDNENPIIIQEFNPKTKRPFAPMQVESDFDPQKVPYARPKDKMMVSPITGEMIHADSLAEHMKISLLDPRWKEQKQRLEEEKRKQELVFNVGNSVSSHLKQMAQRRSDIFGPSLEETAIGKKLDENKSHPIAKPFPQKVVRSSVKIANSSGIKGTLPLQKDIPLVTPMSIQNPAFVQVTPNAFETPAETGERITSAAEAMLIPEAIFVASTPRHEIAIKLIVPAIEELKIKNGWKLDGQLETIHTNMTYTIAQLKNQIATILGVPAPKQKLIANQNLYTKDMYTLAYYNLTDSSYLSLVLKERGGRK